MRSLPALVALSAICATSVAVTAKTVPTKIPGSQLEKSLETEPFAITIDDLALPIAGNDKFHESVIPDKVKALNGKRVRLIGLMYSRLGDMPVSSFVFNGYTKVESDFHEDSHWQHFIQVSLKRGASVRTTSNAIEVEGRFVIRPRFANGKLFQLYFLEDAVVRPSEPPKGFHQPPWLLPVFSC